MHIVRLKRELISMEKHMQVILKMKSNHIRNVAAFLLAFTFLGVVGAVAQEAAAGASKQAEANYWDMIKHGGPTLVVLLLCSVFTMTLIIERFMFYRKATANTAAMIEKIKQAGTLSDALTSIETEPGISGRVLRVALTAARDGYPAEQVEQLVQGEVTKELIGMERWLPQIDSMVTMCPLIGLLGTTLGMIRSFSIVSKIGMSDPTKLAGGISEALVNTAAGLAVAIPALFAFNFFTGRKEAILMDMEKGLSELMVILKSSESQE